MAEREWQGKDRCPHCRDIELEQRRKLGVSFLGCPACGGVWIGVSHMTAYVEAVTKDAGAGAAFREILSESIRQDEEDGAHLRYCIRCPTYLERFGFGERPFVIADRCLEHGLWLDDGDMDKMIRQARAADKLADGGLGDGEPARRAPSQPSADLGSGPFVCPNCGRRFPEGDADRRCDRCNVVLYRG